MSNFIGNPMKRINPKLMTGLSRGLAASIPTPGPSLGGLMSPVSKQLTKSVGGQFTQQLGEKLPGLTNEAAEVLENPEALQKAQDIAELSVNAINLKKPLNSLLGGLSLGPAGASRPASGVAGMISPSIGKQISGKLVQQFAPQIGSQLDITR